MQETSIPINLWFWLLAVSPLLVMSFLLVKLRWTAQQAGAIGMLVAGVVAFFVVFGGIDFPPPRPYGIVYITQ